MTKRKLGRNIAREVSTRTLPPGKFSKKFPGCGPTGSGYGDQRRRPARPLPQIRAEYYGYGEVTGKKKQLSRHGWESGHTLCNQIPRCAETWIPVQHRLFLLLYSVDRDAESINRTNLDRYKLARTVGGLAMVLVAHRQLPEVLVNTAMLVIEQGSH